VLAFINFEPEPSGTTIHLTATDNTGAVDASPATIPLIGNNPPVAKNDATTASISSTVATVYQHCHKHILKYQVILFNFFTSQWNISISSSSATAGQ
jgi:hypothetical protein